MDDQQTESSRPEPNYNPIIDILGGIALGGGLDLLISTDPANITLEDTLMQSTLMGASCGVSFKMANFSTSQSIKRGIYFTAGTLVGQTAYYLGKI